jgi:membrane-associated phospholipid phosphatase
MTRALFGAFEGPGGSFPSSHVALAIVTAWFSWSHLPRLRWLHLALVPLLSAATVYGRYHYLVDVFAGVVTGALLLAAGNWLHHRIEHTETQPTARS